MALRKSRGAIPENARIVSPQEALTYQRDKIREWPNKRDVWPFSYGAYILSGMGTISAMVINMTYRKKLKMKNYALISSILPTAFASGIICGAYHSEIVQSDVLLNKTSCPICLLCNAAFMQITLSIIYPFVVSPLVNVPFASRYATYRVPYVGDLKGNIEFFKTITKPCRRKLLPFALAQSLVACYVTYAETESLKRIEHKMMMTEEFDFVKTRNIE